MLSTQKPQNQFNEIPQNIFLFSSFELEYKYHFVSKDSQTRRKLFITDSIASSFSRLQYNRKDTFLQYLIIDCDNDNYIKILNEDYPPKPNYIIKNKNKSGAHLFFVLDRPILKSASFEYFKNKFFNIHKSLTSIYQGDKQNRGYIGKNYLNHYDFDGFYMSYKAYSLQDLEQYVLKEFLEQPTTTKKRTNHKISTDSFSNLPLDAEVGARNNTLFIELSNYGRVIFKSKSLLEHLTNKAEQINENFKTPLPLTEVKATVYSVYKYYSNPNYKPKRKPKEKKLMNIENLSQTEKEKAGAKYSAEKKRTRTELEIINAIKLLKLRNEKITYKAISEITKKSLRTIKDYSKIIKNNK